MEQLIEQTRDQLGVKGYSQFEEPFVNEEDNSTIYTASGDGKIVYVKLLSEDTELSPEMQEASLFEAQSYDPFPDFVWVTNGEKNFYGDCFESGPLAEIPSVLDVQVKEKKKLTVRELWSREMYPTLQKRFDDLHERLYGPAGKDNVSSTNEAIDELSKFIFMEIFRLYHPEYTLGGEYAGLRLYDILDYRYIEEHREEAVAQIRDAFKQIKHHDDYVAINDDGEKCPIFNGEEYLKLENPSNYVAIFKTLQDLGEFIDDEGNTVIATLKDLTGDVLGRLYDVLLRGKYDNKQGQATYLTPREVTEAMVAMVLHDIISDPQESSKIIEVDENGIPTFRILDPTCGSGGFLIYAYEGLRKYLTNQFTGPMRETVLQRFELMKENSFIGADSSRNMVLKARLNMALHGLPRAPIFWIDNSLTSGSLKANHYDVILTNPPFGSGSVKNKDKDGKAILDRYCSGIDEYGRPKKEGLCLGAKPDSKGKWKQVNSTDQAVLFLDRNLQLLKPGGYLLMILPDGILSNSGYKHVREYIMGKKNEVTGEFEGGRAIVKAVVSLPTVTFQLSGTKSKTSFLYLRKKKDESEKQGPIFMAVADEIGFDVKQKKRVPLGNDRNDLLKIIDEYKKGSDLITKIEEPLYTEKKIAFEGLNKLPSYSFVNTVNLSSYKSNAEYYHPKYIYLENKFLKNIVEFGELIESVTNGPHGGVTYVENGGVPYLRAQNIEGCTINLNNPVYISEEDHFKHIRAEVRPGDIIVTITGFVGLSAIIPDWIPRANIIQSLAKVKVNEELINKYYLVIYLNSRIGQLLAYRQASITAQPGLNFESLKKIQIYLPSKEIQERIGQNVKDSIDKKRMAELLVQEAKKEVEDFIKGNFN